MSNQNDIRSLIRLHYRRLQKLKEKQALYGISADPSIEIEIEEIEAKIESLQIELKEVESQVETLSPVEQHKRILNGLDEQRRILSEFSEKRRASRAQRVVGQRLTNVSTFKNRTLFRQELGKMLTDPNVRVISVVGRGGIGKTQLVSKVLSDLEGGEWLYTDEVLHFDGLIYLSTRTTGITLERVFRECAAMLGGEKEKEINRLWTNTQIKVRDKINHLLSFMTKGLYIILFDNLEDLLDKNQVIIDEDLQKFISVSLSTTHSLKLLITTRVPVQLPREFLHFDKRILLKEGLPVEEGVQLLRELDPNGEFGLLDSSDELLSRAVELVQGVPRALEIIAGILANDMFITLDELLNEFFSREEVINDLIMDAYKRLDAASKMVMEALAVYVYPVPIVAIDYLLEPFAKGVNIPRIVQKLARTYNVSVNRKEKTVSLHPIDRDYIYSQLPYEGERSRFVLESRAADYYAQLRLPREEWQSIDDIEPQLKEFEHLVRARDYDLAAKLMNELDPQYLLLWGYAQRVRDMRQKLVGKINDSRLAVLNLTNLGKACDLLADYEQAIDYFSQALSIARNNGDKLGESDNLNIIGYTYDEMGNYEEAIKHSQQALEVALETDDKANECFALHTLGIISRHIGEREDAIDYYNRALPIAQEIGDHQREAHILRSTAKALKELGRLEEAADSFNKCIAISERIGAKYIGTSAYIALADTYIRMGRISEAIKILQKYLPIALDMGDRRFYARALQHMGRAHLYLDKIEESVNFYKRALEIEIEIGNKNHERINYAGLGKAYLNAGNYEQALSCYQNALSLDREMNLNEEVIRHEYTIGNICLKMNSLEQAISHYEVAIRIACELGIKDYQGYCLRELGRIHVVLKNFEKAREFFKEGINVFRTINKEDEINRLIDLLEKTPSTNY